MSNQFLKEQLKSSVREYLKIDDQMTALSKALRERRKRKKELSEIILKLMETHDITHMNLKDGKLVYKESNNLVPLNKTQLTSALALYLRDEHKALELCDFIMKNRSRKKKARLKRTKKKKDKENAINI